MTGTGLRYAAWHKNNMTYLNIARIFFATDIIVFIVRLLQIFSVNKNLGPKLVMIRKMVCIFAVCLPSILIVILNCSVLINNNVKLKGLDWGWGAGAFTFSNSHHIHSTMSFTPQSNVRELFSLWFRSYPMGKFRGWPFCFHVVEMSIAKVISNILSFS